MGKSRNWDLDRDADEGREHSTCLMGKAEKREKLAEVLLDPLCDPAERTIVLVESRFKADFVALYLASLGLPVNNIHEEKVREEKERAVFEFQSGDKPILVVTPDLTHDLVLALDTRDVAHIIDYDMNEGGHIEILLLLIGYWDNPGKLTSFVESTKGIRMQGV